MLLKWVVLGAIIAAVWYGFKAIARRNRAAQVKSEREARENVEDMSPCRVCGTYVTGDQRACGRDDCPLKS